MSTVFHVCIYLKKICPQRDNMWPSSIYWSQTVSPPSQKLLRVSSHSLHLDHTLLFSLRVLSLLGHQRPWRQDCPPPHLPSPLPAHPSCPRFSSSTNPLPHSSHPSSQSSPPHSPRATSTTAVPGKRHASSPSASSWTRGKRPRPLKASPVSPLMTARRRSNPSR